ncbi:MAG: hypothetical protein JNM68_10680, partial [Dinghuibacter sp.]|nr:hypothetical protein [Dinghuibacter sp.]
MKKFISACMGPFILLSVFAQSGSTLLKPDVPKVIPPAPNAASLGKFGEIPVNYSSGIPSIGHPIFSWGRGKLNVSLGLSYHAGGHKVEDMPSDVGLGWSLTGVARVSRAARGLPDDDPINGFIHTPAAPQSVTYNYPQQIPASKNGFIYFNEETMGAVTADLGFVPYNNADYGYFKEVSDNAKDGEQDVFNYSAGGKSGKFVINRNKEVVHLEHTTAKITFTTYPLNHASIPLRGRIKSFTITDDNGVIYLFEETETQSAETTTSGNTSLSANPISSYTASWLITKITDPNTQEEITFNYLNQASTYEGSFSQSKSYRLKSTLYNNNSGPEAGAWETEIWSADYGLEESDGGFSFSTINQQQKKISSINLPDGSIIEFQYQMNRADLAGDKALGKILVRNSRNKTIKNVQLNHSYFITPAGELPIVTTNTSNDFLKRLRLDEVVEASVSGPAVSRTKFEYNTLPLNRRDSRNTDYWGYNVNPARNNTALVPKIRLKEEDLPQNLANGIYLGGANRAPDETWCKAGALEKIIYPTGGYTVFEYEPNKAFSAINYYENELQTGEIIFQEAEWNVNKTISFPGRANTLVDFYCKTNEPNLRSPNNGCLEEQQDALPVKMVITSTDGTVTMEIEN